MSGFVDLDARYARVLVSFRALTRFFHRESCVTGSITIVTALWITTLLNGKSGLFVHPTFIHFR